MKKMQITKHTSKEIATMLQSKDDYKTAMRLVCMLQLSKGESSRKVQELFLLSHNQICIWAKRFNNNGLDGLKDKVKSGRKPKLTNKDLIKLKEVIVNESPEKYGFNTATWTAPLISKWIDNYCNIKYSDDNIYLILKNKLGLKHKKGKGFYPEADKEKRAIYIDTIKKTSRNRK